MALGKTNDTDSKGKLLILKLRGKDFEGKPLMPYVFQVSEKGADGKYAARQATETSVSGNITRLILGQEEYEGQAYRTVKLYIEDDKENETYLLDLRYTQITRNLFNALLSLKTFSNVTLSSYSSVGKKDGKTYPNIAVWQNDSLVKGGIQRSDIPSAEEIKDKKGTVIKRDYADVDNFWSGKLQELAERISKPVKKKKTAAATSNSSENDGSIIDYSSVDETVDKNVEAVF